MNFFVITLFPQLVQSFSSCGLLARAQTQEKITITPLDLRRYGMGKHKRVDDTPFGGGSGMLLRPDPVVGALEAPELVGARKVLVSPQGKVFNQGKATELAERQEDIALVCGRYEGFDCRISHYVDEEISLGDFILMGGEVAAMAVIESVSRLIPGVLGNQLSTCEETFSQSGLCAQDEAEDLLEYDQYTKPRSFRGHQVPEVLLSGNHSQIRKWRQENAAAKTRRLRADLEGKRVSL